jgi:PAS domain S-box-containing protein
MTIKPAYEELEQRIKELEAESEKRKAVRTRKDTDLGRKADEFINKFPSAIRKIPPKNIQYLVEDLQIHKTELEMQNEKLRRAQLELQEKQDKYSDLYDNSPVGHFSIDNKGVILEANITGATLLGVERGLLKGRLFSDFITRDDQDIFYLHRKELLETKAKQRCELRLVKKNGSQFYAHLECIAILDKKGKLNQIRAVVSDISEPKLA